MGGGLLGRTSAPGGAEARGAGRGAGTAVAAAERGYEAEARPQPGWAETDVAVCAASALDGCLAEVAPLAGRPRPVRALASIGQVHKGRWHDGREVAVKVQYPRAGEALRSDLRQLARVARSIGPLVPGLDVKPLVAEMQARMEEELDYDLEASAQRAFAAAYAGDPDIVVPDVVAHGPATLVTEWLDSTSSLAKVIAEGTQEERDRFGDLFTRFLLGAPGLTGMLPSGPPPGNFRVVPGIDGGPLPDACSTTAPSRGCPTGCRPPWAR